MLKKKREKIGKENNVKEAIHKKGKLNQNMTEKEERRAGKVQRSNRQKT